MSEPVHPYKTQPDRAFWARAVSADFEASTLVTEAAPLIRRGERVVSAGSCFAANLVPYLERAGLTYLRTETLPPVVLDALEPRPPKLVALARRARASIGWRRAPTAPDNFGYARFSAAYGNIYTVRQLLQLLRRATGRLSPKEDCWEEGEACVDPFRPGLRYPARSRRELAALTAQHLARTRAAFAAADVFVLTLGLTEAWISRVDGAVFPACPGTVAGRYDPARHTFHNFTAAEVAGDLDTFIGELREINPEVRLLLTVSPVPLVATAEADHVLCASTYSKSVLRVAAQDAVRRHRDVVYFPAYELVTGPQAPKGFLAPDRRNVTPAAVDLVMGTLLAHCETSVQSVDAPRPRSRAPALGAAIVEAECEEMMSAR